MGILLGRLQELGYAEGRNLVLEYRTSQGRNERYLALATELVNLKVNVIIAPGTAAAEAAKAATSSIPIVTIVVGDPVESGLIKSLARPGGNVTGTSSAASEVTAKQLELLKEIVPRLSRIAVLANPSTPLHVTVLGDRRPQPDPCASASIPSRSRLRRTSTAPSRRSPGSGRRR